MSSAQTSASAAGLPRSTKSSARQKRELLELVVRHRLTPNEYQVYGFHQAHVDHAYILNFMTGHELKTFRETMNDRNWKAVLDNKWFFQLHYGQFDLPVPKIYGIYDRGTGFASTGKPLAHPEDLRALLQEVRPPALVIKPLGGIMGKGLLILKEIHYEGDEIRAVTNTGANMDFNDLAEYVERRPDVVFKAGDYELDYDGYLLQAKLEQHEFLDSIAPYTINTFRVVTFVDYDNQVDVQFTILRLGRRGNMADNWDRGGISVAVDRDSGVLGDGVLKPKYGGQWMQVHPDSGVRFTGRKVPYWNEILDVCTRAAKVSPRIRSIGWDVALTPAGPVIIEGNPDWDLPMVQVHTRGFLQPEVRTKLSRFGLMYPQQRLPGASLAGGAQLFKHAWARVRPPPK